MAHGAFCCLPVLRAYRLHQAVGWMEMKNLVLSNKGWDPWGWVESNSYSDAESSDNTCLCVLSKYEAVIWPEVVEP